VSSRIPLLAGRKRPHNLVLLLRESFVALNQVVLTRLEENGHDAIRPAHGAVFQFLDDTGTTVSVLAQRAQMTKQAMAQLVQHLESEGYVERVPDPADRRAKLVTPTDRGLEVMRAAQDLVPEIERRIAAIIGADRSAELRRDLEAIRTALSS
jgi:DNA-binding MarR family transcriptional regulator